MVLSGKTAVVTGGSAGIGQEIVRRLASEGARVISMDWAEPSKELSGVCESVHGDVSSAADVKRVFDAAGPVDILVNNAAFSKGDGFLLDLSEEIWDRTLSVCLKSVFLCSQAALSTMVERRSGAIVNISSVNALTGIHLAAYTAAKGGIISLTRVLAAQYGRHGVRINTICPGTILSESSRIHYDAHPEITLEGVLTQPPPRIGTLDIGYDGLAVLCQMVHDAGGLASMAHPGLVGRDHWIPGLAAAGLDAIEAYHTDHDADAIARYRAMAHRLTIAVSGGSDYHADESHGAPHPGSVSLPRDDFDRLVRLKRGTTA